MNCEEIRNLALLADCGEATAAEAAAVRAHEAGCPACAAEIRAVREGLDLLRHVPVETPSEGARAALGGLILREGAGRVPAGRSWRLAAAAVAAAFLLAFAAWRAFPEREPAATGGVETARPGDNQPAGGVDAGPEPAVRAPDPVVAWESRVDLDSIRETLASLRPSSTVPVSTPTDEELWFSSGSSASSFDTLYNELDALASSGTEGF